MYVEDPVKAEEAKQKGNEFFGKQQYPEAIKQCSWRVCVVYR